MSLILQRKQGRSSWYIRGTINGHRVNESTATSDKALAEAYRVKREYELFQEALHGKAAVATFAQAALHYLEHGGSTSYMEPVLLHFASTRLKDIGQEQIDAAAKRLYPKATGSTRNRQVYGIVSAVLHHAASLGWCGVPKIKRPKSPPGRVRWLKKDEADKLIEAADHGQYPGAVTLKALVMFLFYTGARVGEALWLDWDNVDLERKQVQFIDTKNGTSRGVPLHERVVDELRKTNHRIGCVFRRPDGKEYTRPKPDQDADHSAGTRIKSAFKGACVRAGIKDFHPHACRHTWATWHYIANRDLSALMHLGGWKTMSMVMRYTHVNVEELASTIERL